MKKKSAEPQTQVLAKEFKKEWLLLPLLGIFFCAFVNILLALLGVTTVSYSNTQDVLSDFAEMPFFSIIIQCILAPILEEFLFRKLLYGKLSNVIPWWIAMLISAVLFGVFHFNIPQGIYGFAFGLILCETMRRCKSWIAPLIVHASANILSVVMNSVPALNEYFVAHSLLLMILFGIALCITFFLFELLSKEKQMIENNLKEV